MKELIVFGIAGVLVALAFLLSRRRPGAATTAVPRPIDPHASAADADDAASEDEQHLPAATIVDEATHAAEVEALKGTPGPALAAAQHRLALAIARKGDFARAVTWLESAVQVSTTNESDERARLDHVVTLGEVLARLGRAAEAERLLRDHLPAREAAYGRLNAGYAAGLAPLARLVLARGDAGSAAALAEEAAAVLSATHHDNAPMAVGFASAARLAAGSAPAHAEKISGDDLTAFLSGFVDACDVLPPELHAKGLAFAIDLVTRKGLLHSPAGVGLLDRYAGLQRMRGAVAEAESAYARLMEVADALGKGELAITAGVGRALCRTEGGDLEGAENVFRVILDAAERAPAEQRCFVRREYGLWLTRKDKDASLAMLDLAVQDGREAGPMSEALGRSLAAAGVWRMHAGESATAEKHLQEAMPLLPEGHVDLPAVKDHLAAIAAKAPCECMRRGQLEHELTRAVSVALGEGFARVRMQSGPAGTSFGIEFVREPTAQQLEAAKSAIEAALKARAPARAPQPGA